MSNEKEDKKKVSAPRRLGAVEPDKTFVDETRIAALRKMAEQDVHEELTKEHEELLLEQFKQEARQAKLPQEELQEIQIDLPGHAPHVMLDNVIYLHGHTYTLPRNQVDSIKDIMARAWDHENDIGGANRDVYRKPRNQRISQNGPGSASLMRV
jgi:hypothetical protein